MMITIYFMEFQKDVKIIYFFLSKFCKQVIQLQINFIIFTFFTYQYSYFHHLLELQQQYNSSRPDKSYVLTQQYIVLGHRHGYLPNKYIYLARGTVLAYWTLQVLGAVRWVFIHPIYLPTYLLSTVDTSQHTAPTAIFRCP